MRALVFRRFGGPEVLEYAEVSPPVLLPDQVLVKTHAIGMNFADIYRRQGRYHLAGEPPYIAGYEASGVITDANGHTHLGAGTRVGFADVPFANADLVAVPVDRLIQLPDDITFECATSVLLQGLTAQYLVCDSAKVRPGEVCVVHAAAGGVGQLLVQILKLHGAVAIAVTSSRSKADIALECGADAVLLYSENWTESIRSQTNGLGAEVVFDSVGSTLGESLLSARDCGRVVFYGMSGGDPTPIDPRMLMDRSLTLTGGDLWSYLTSFEERAKRASSLFEWIRSGRIRVSKPTLIPLSQGREAHRQMESRQSTGKILLIPN
jgi:NADPH:quinone reductase